MAGRRHTPGDAKRPGQIHTLSAASSCHVSPSHGPCSTPTLLAKTIGTGCTTVVWICWGLRVRNAQSGHWPLAGRAGLHLPPASCRRRDRALESREVVNRIVNGRALALVQASQRPVNDTRGRTLIWGAWGPCCRLATQPCRTVPTGRVCPTSLEPPSGLHGMAVEGGGPGIGPIEILGRPFVLVAADTVSSLEWSLH